MNNPILAIIPPEKWHELIQSDWVSWADVQEITAFSSNLPFDETIQYNISPKNVVHNLNAPYELVAEHIALNTQRYKQIIQEGRKYYDKELNQSIKIGSPESNDCRLLTNHPSIPIENIRKPRVLLQHPSMNLKWFMENYTQLPHMNELLNFPEEFYELYAFIRPNSLAEDIAWIDAFLLNMPEIRRLDQQKYKFIACAQQVSFEDCYCLDIRNISSISSALSTTYGFMRQSIPWIMDVHKKCKYFPGWLYSNFHFTVEDFKDLPNFIPINWKKLSRNPNFTLDFIRSHDGEWDWECVSSNPSLRLKDIKWLVDNNRLNTNGLRRNKFVKDPSYHFKIKTSIYKIERFWKSISIYRIHVKRLSTAAIVLKRIPMDIINIIMNFYVS
jgi:hypothetical protein